MATNPSAKAKSGQSPEELARVVATGETDEVQTVAFEKLVPTIERTARWLAVGFSGFSATDVCDEAPGIIWNKLRDGEFRTAANFCGWCRKVIRNELLDRMRSDNRRKNREQAYVESRSGSKNDRRGVELAIDRAAPFSDDDLARLSHWPVQKRVVVLALYGLWHKVPPDDWNAWVDECGFEQPFPPPEMLDAEEPRQRIRPLSEATGIGPNTISQINRRYGIVGRLRELSYIEELMQ